MASKGKGYWQEIIRTMKNKQKMILEPNGRNKANGFYLAAKSLGYKSRHRMIDYEKYEVTFLK